MSFVPPLSAPLLASSDRMGQALAGAGILLLGCFVAGVITETALPRAPPARAQTGGELARRVQCRAAMTTPLRAFALAAAAASTLAAFPASAEPPLASAALPPAPASVGVYTPPPPVIMERRSLPLLLGGIGGILAGTGMLTGAVVEAVRGICFNLGFGPASSPCYESHPPVIIGLTVGGLVALAAGIPMVVVGEKRVPRWAGAPAGRGWEWRF